METRNFWEENGHSVKYENYSEEFPRASSHSDQLNFATVPSEDEAEYPQNGYLKKGKVTRQDPMSHRIIEKRRRDRMNNCLADLSRLIPPDYLKKGRGRVEKTEIIEMAIRHLKYLGERANASERQITEPGEHFRAGYQEAASEAVRYLVEVQGYGPGDALCVQMSSHLQRQCEVLCKDPPQEKPRFHHHGNGGTSSETTSSSGSNSGYVMKTGVITRTDVSATEEPYDHAQSDPTYTMDCDRVASLISLGPDECSVPEEPLPLDATCKRETTLRAIRKPEHNDDYLHLYKFKNSIQRRFSRSQDNEASDFTVPDPAHNISARSSHLHRDGRQYSHKRRRAVKPPSTTTSNSGSTEEARDTSPQDTSSESPHRHVYEKPVTPMAQFVPVFALNSLGKYYVPLNIEYACLARHLGPYDVLDARAAHLTAPLHPVTINVNFQPYLSYVKRESDREWRAP